MWLTSSCEIWSKMPNFVDSYEEMRLWSERYSDHAIVKIESNNVSLRRRSLIALFLLLLHNNMKKVQLPLDDDENNARRYDDGHPDVNGFGYANGKVQIIQQINHDGEVNMARCMPQNPLIIAFKIESMLSHLKRKMGLLGLLKSAPWFKAIGFNGIYSILRIRIDYP
ncbi:hypothetical protein VNO77_23185 [Canavalia gladiata]|uniref:Uncharacterized protein n=1 Tax=Canavalia gladiata TaxID=3824 RepID=A0AAN9L400_CANGL